MTNLEQAMNHIEEMNNSNQTCGCDFCRSVSEGDYESGRRVLAGNNVDPDAEAVDE